MSRIAVLGSVNMDVVVRATRLPAPGETVLGESRTEMPGGKGANQAVAAARMGAQVWFIGAVGNDPAAAVLRERFAGAGVGVSELRTIDGPSGLASITVGSDGENSIVVIPGANSAVERLSAPDLARIRDCDLLLMQLELPISVVEEAAAVAHRAGVTVILNPSPFQPLSKSLLSRCDALIANEVEHQQLGSSAARVRHLIVTRGAAGAWLRSTGGESLRVAALSVAAVDTTGAGDAFAGACAALWHTGAASAVHWGCVAGALAATRTGAYSPTYGEVAEKVLESELDG
ncbi:ribokinase [Hoyosella sp. YIM 151337]|uniref:ribokinase n=1 Tax=Hoyosella sp. YIM 151337 TaxID=2992742 RepID=UPI002235918D|nr:ribokinase [Hoyosella sp. YIM 151337]MCW4355261.1 ribokinase [Hoyosella sp. YIM 151337]